MLLTFFFNYGGCTTSLFFTIFISVVILTLAMEFKQLLKKITDSFFYCGSFQVVWHFSRACNIHKSPSTKRGYFLASKNSISLLVLVFSNNCQAEVNKNSSSSYLSILWHIGSTSIENEIITFFLPINGFEIFTN